MRAKTATITALAGLALLASSPAIVQAEVSPEEAIPSSDFESAASEMQAALDFVRGSGAGRSFGVMLLAHGMDAETTGELITEFGEPAVRKIVEEEIETAVKLYGLQWDNNLARAYLAHLTAPEIRSLMDQRDSSPHMDKLRLAQQGIRITMERLSGALLSIALDDVAQKTYDRMKGE